MFWNLTENSYYAQNGLKPCVRTEGPLLLHTFADYVNVQVNLFCFVLFLFLWQFFQVRPYRGEQTRLKHL